MTKSILIVGAGFGQLPAIDTAKKLRLTTIVVDKNSDAIGAKAADFFYNIDIIDKEGVLGVAKKHSVSGIMTMQSDLPVPTIGYVNDALGLNGVSFKVANICSNKNETRIELKKRNASQPCFEITSTLEEAIDAAKKIGFPCVVKASDSSGSRGITKIYSLDEIENAFEEALHYSRNKAIIVEEFIEGIEFGAQTFSVNGKCELVLLHNDRMSNPPYMIPIGHSFPFIMLNKKESEQAVEDIRNAVEAVGIMNGPANIDLILDVKSRKVKVIEIGARIGATCLPELVYYHTGIDWVENTILNAINETVNLIPIFEKPVAALILESPKDGIYQGYAVDQDIEEQALEFEITAQQGEEVNILRKGTDRIGKILAYGKTVKEAEILATKLRDSIKITVT